MLEIAQLLAVADRYGALTGLPETTVSHRLFADTKRLGQMRNGGEITVGRFNGAMRWLAENWPDGSDLPDNLAAYRSPAPETPNEDAA